MHMHGCTAQLGYHRARKEHEKCSCKSGFDLRPCHPEATACWTGAEAERAKAEAALFAEEDSAKARQAAASAKKSAKKKAKAGGKAKAAAAQASAGPAGGAEGAPAEARTGAAAGSAGGEEGAAGTPKEEPAAPAAAAGPDTGGAGRADAGVHMRVVQGQPAKRSACVMTVPCGELSPDR